MEVVEKLLRVWRRVGELWECAKDSERGRAQKGSECVHMCESWCGVSVHVCVISGVLAACGG